MTALRVLAARILSLFRSARMDADLDDEIRHHLEQSTREYLSRGLGPAAARDAALAAFGGRLRAKELYADARGFQRLESALGDAPGAPRACRKAPTFTAVRVAPPALGRPPAA